MAHYAKNVEGFSASQTVKIKGTEALETHTVYTIELNVGPYKWTVRHRYSEFFELHEKLVLQYKIEKGLLPPKKIFGNQTESFIRKRQGELEIYLQTILHHLTVIPPFLAVFLDFPKYEIHGLMETLAEELYHKGDLILAADEQFYISPLQLHAMCSRLTLPEPTCDSGDATKDLGHVLDFVTRLKALKIVGSPDKVGTSNIVMNQLSFHLNHFHSLETLEIVRCNCTVMSGVDHLKKSLKRLVVRQSLQAIKDVLLLGLGEGQWLAGEAQSVLIPAWSALCAADFSRNKITAIDQSVKLMARIESLDLSHNALHDIQELQHLSTLTHVDLSNNAIEQLNSLHTKLGNIKTLNLANNKLESLLGFSRLYSLENLDLSGNNISQVLEIRHISSLPCLEGLVLTGNPVTIVVDYRTKILELFAERAREICLDHQRPSQKELDTVAILLAIQKSKETKERAKKHVTKKKKVPTATLR